MKAFHAPCDLHADLEIAQPVAEFAFVEAQRKPRVAKLAGRKPKPLLFLALDPFARGITRFKKEGLVVVTMANV